MWDANCQRIDRLEDGAVSISMASWGMANRGWRMSLVWVETPPERLLSSNDEFHRTSTSQWQDAYSRLEQNWYLRIIW
jgi:hypothetical protein